MYFFSSLYVSQFPHLTKRASGFSFVYNNASSALSRSHCLINWSSTVLNLFSAASLLFSLVEYSYVKFCFCLYISFFSKYLLCLFLFYLSRKYSFQYFILFLPPQLHFLQIFPVFFSAFSGNTVSDIIFCFYLYILCRSFLSLFLFYPAK